jgi:hypothetical protein
MKLKKAAALLTMLALVAVLPVFAATFPLTLNFHSAVLNVSFPTPGDQTTGNRGIETELKKGRNDENTLDYTGNLYSVAVPNGVAFYGIAYFDYTGGTLANTANDDAIDGALTSGGLSEVPGSRENTQLAGLFARETVGTSTTLDAFIRTAQQGNREFLAVVVAEKTAHVTQDDADAYFASISRN